jgi:Ras-related protein Rab-1A
MSYNHVIEFDHIFRVLFVGDESVGKTSILKRYIDHLFSDIYIPTPGIDFRISTVKLDKKVIKLQLYDTGGSNYLRSIVSTYYPNSDAIVIVYDISDINSFRHVEGWLNNILHHKKDKHIPKILIGNKSDLPSYHRSISFLAGETLARQYDMIFFEMSAKSKVYTKDIFVEICKECLLVKELNEGGPLLSNFDSADKKETKESKKYWFCC